MSDKACRRCGEWKPLTAFPKDKTKRDGHSNYCSDCRAIGNQQWRKNNLEALKEKKRTYYYENREKILKLRNVARNGAKYLNRLKQEVFNHYGNKCYCCGLDDPRFLTIEHLNNDGSTVRHKTGKRARVSGSSQYRYIIDAGFPDDIALSCYNCNCARAYWGKGRQCPHQAPLSATVNKETLFIDETQRRVECGDFDLPTWLPKEARNDPDVQWEAEYTEKQRRSDSGWKLRRRS